MAQTLNYHYIKITSGGTTGAVAADSSGTENQNVGAKGLAFDGVWHVARPSTSD